MRRQAELAQRVLGDPRVRVGFPTPPPIPVNYD